MQISEKFGLTLPEQEDYYDISVYAENLRQIDKNAVAGIGGITKIRVLSSEDYTALDTPVEDVLYIVTDGEAFRLYLGTLSLASGAGRNSIGILTAHLLGVTGTTGIMEIPTETEE